VTGRQRDFDLPAYRLAGLEWGAGRPVLALHGWLDNAGSFRLLAPLLDGCHVVAFDAAGHGYSGNRSVDSAYNIWQEVSDVYDIADALGWDRFTLLGHSRGAGVSMLFASAFPDRVEQLVFIDGGLPIIGKAEDAPEGLGRAIVESRKLRTKKGRVFPSRARAIEERMNGFTAVSAAAAEILAERSLDEVEGGWQWHADQRLKAHSEIKLTRELTREFIRGVTAPVLAIQAADGPFIDRADFREMWPEFRDLDLQALPGGHHLHLEGAEQEIARRTLTFLAARSGPGS